MKILLFAFLILTCSARILFFDDLESGLSNFNSDTTSGQQADCPGTGHSKCLLITKKVQGGDLFTKAFENPTSPADASDVIQVQFEYFANSYTGKPENSSLVVGGVYEDKSHYFWVAMGDLTSIPEKESYAVRIIDQVGQWQLIRFHIKPDKMLNKLMLVFQDFFYSKSTPGNYYIDNILVTYASECATGCEICANYLKCDKCKPTYLALSDGSCVNNNCITMLEDGSAQQIVASKVGSRVKVVVGKYDLENCFEANIKQLNSDGTLSDVLNKQISNSQIEFDACNDSTCKYQLTIKHKSGDLAEQTLLSREFEIAGNNGPSSDITIETEVIEIPIEASLLACIGIDCSFQEYTGTAVNVVLFDYFQVRLKVITSTFQSWIVKKVGVQMKGSGTLIQLQIENFIDSVPGEITYNVSVSLAAYGQMELVVKGSLLNPETSRRRILADTTNKQMAQVMGVNLTLRDEIHGTPDFGGINIIVAILLGAFLSI